MDGMPAMQEQVQAMSRDGRYACNAGASAGDVQGWTVCLQCRSNCRRCPGMDGMPAMQEQLQAMSRDGRYACNAGAIAGDVQGWTVPPATQERLPGRGGSPQQHSETEATQERLPGRGDPAP